MKDLVKRPEGLPARSWDPEGFSTSIFQKKMLESRPEDALVKLVKTVENVGTEETQETQETVETVETVEIAETVRDCGDC